MSDMEEVAPAEARMNAAREALFFDRARGRVIDREQYQRLVTRVKKAEQEFMNAVQELNR